MQRLAVLCPRTVCVPSLAACNSFRPDIESSERASDNNFQPDNLVWLMISQGNNHRRRTVCALIHQPDNNFRPDTHLVARASDNSTRLHIVVRRRHRRDNTSLAHTSYTMSQTCHSPVNTYPPDKVDRTSPYRPSFDIHRRCMHPDRPDRHIRRLDLQFRAGRRTVPYSKSFRHRWSVEAMDRE